MFEAFSLSKSVTGMAESTLEVYKYQIEAFFNFLNKNVSDMTPVDIRKYLLHCKENGNSQSTVNTKIHALRSFFRFLERDEIIKNNPMHKIDTPIVTNNTPDYLSHEEIERIRDVADGIDKVIFEVLYNCGIRVSELVGLDWNNINWQEKKMRVTGKGNKTRTVPISTKAIMALKKERERRKDDGPYVIRSRHHRRMSRTNIYRRMIKIGEKASIDRKVHPVILRHTFATHLLECGAPIDIVQSILGHAQLDTTRIYAETQQTNIDHEYRKVFK